MEGAGRIRSLYKLIQKQTGQLGIWPVKHHSSPNYLEKLLIVLSEEHHIANFDPASFFTLHDFDDNGFWDKQEILKFYGMEDETAKDVPQSKKDAIIKEMMTIMDSNGNEIIEREEFMAFVVDRKGTLPDFGTGPGHHWDIEMEYEIHHWEK